MVFLSSIFFYSCKKTDLPSPLGHRGSEQIKIANKFFKVPAGTDPAVQQIINEVIKRNNKKEFVSGFAAKNGYPVWDKVLAVKSRTKNANNIVGNTPSDTVIYIPLVLPDSININGFIRATINDSIALNYSLSKDYKAYSFSNYDSLSRSDKYALLIMKLENLVFGAKTFIITDHRLFTRGINDTVNSISGTKTLKFVDATSNIVYSNNVVTTGVTCQDFNITLCLEDIPPLHVGSTNNYNSENITTRRCNTWKWTECWSNWGDDNPPGNPPPTGGGGGSGGIPYYYPCNPNIIPIDDIVPGDPLPPCPLPGPGTGWVPVGNQYLDYTLPPFSWVFNGDDGTSFIDPDPLEEPDFVLDPTDNYETIYPRFTNMVKNLKTFVKNNPKILNALQKWSGFSKQQILDNLTYGQGPRIIVEEMTGRYAWYKREAGSNLLRVRASYVRGLESAYLDETKDGTAFLLAVSILHEYIHLGTNHNNISEGKYEFGLGFEIDAFNVIVEDTNANEVVIKFSQYF